MSFYSSMSFWDICLAASSREITLFHVTKSPMNYWQSIPNDLSFLYFASSWSLSSTIGTKCWRKVFSLLFSAFLSLVAFCFSLLDYWGRSSFTFFVVLVNLLNCISPAFSFLFLNLISWPLVSRFLVLLWKLLHFPYEGYA